MTFAENKKFLLTNGASPGSYYQTQTVHCQYTPRHQQSIISPIIIDSHPSTGK